MTPEEQAKIDAVTAKLSGDFAVGMKVKFNDGKVGTVVVGTIIADDKKWVRVSDGGVVTWVEASNLQPA